jgi:hypothetical protein
MKDNNFFRGIRGPVGSGKSVACCVEVFRRALEQNQNHEGIRKSRWAIIRNTNPQLRTTTIKTWLDWFPENEWGKFHWSVPYTHQATMLVKPDNWTFYTQPAAMKENLGEKGEVLSYSPTSKAENSKNILQTYYPNIVRGKTKSWIDVYVMNRLGMIQDGKPVYPDFVSDTHIAEEEIPVAAGVPLYIGIDFGLTPSAVFGQKVRGRWLLQSEIVAIDMGIVRFAELLRQEIATRFNNLDVYIYGDPAGDFRAQTDETTPFGILRGAGLKATPAPSNSIDLRLESVSSQLTKMVDGKSGLLIDRRCPQIIKGFQGGYCYRRMQVSGERYEDKPEKNMYSHIHDALQYLMLGAGEGRSLMSGQKPVTSFNARKGFDLFKRPSISRTRTFFGNDLRR